MAQAIYREWFVNFRFPGHEKVKMVKSELGMIPEGWEVKRISDFGEVVTGKTPSKKKPEYYNDNYMPFIKTPDMHDNMFVLQTGECLSQEGAFSQKNKTLPSDSICVSCIGTVGIVSIISHPSQTNQQINSIVLKNKNKREFLYFTLKDLRETIKKYGSTGATMTNLNKGKFENLKIICPDESIINSYHDKVRAMFDNIRTLLMKNNNLRKTRDLLLPKLISGEIDVERMDINTEVIR
ncbi:MAG: restriction endonuclease subunit S [Thermodesulfovibrionia bacterium]|nr:restriction endonuclease subunit S [Thermodesulfovibrionia bacterium]